MYIFNLFHFTSIHIIQVFSFVCVLTWPLLGNKKSLGHAQIGLFWGFNSKFPTSIRTTFICGVPPPRVLKLPIYYETRRVAISHAQAPPSLAIFPVRK